MTGVRSEPRGGPAKQAVRERVWALLERERVARFPGATGRIPNFAGAPAAAARLASLAARQAAGVVKANPDAPQLPVRARALADGKLLYMAVPRLADERPFILLDPERVSLPSRRAASIAGSARAGRRIGVAELGPVNLVVCGSVAVNREGARVGKGGGFSDLEFALLVEAGLIDPDTVVATTVHPLQLLAEALPESAHDFRLDLIVAGEEVIGGPAPDGRMGSSGSIWTQPRSPPSPSWPPGCSAQRFSGDVPLFPGRARVNDKRVRGSGGSRTAIQGELHHGRGNPLDMPQFVFLTVGLVGVA